MTATPQPSAPEAAHLWRHRLEAAAARVLLRAMGGIDIDAGAQVFPFAPRDLQPSPAGAEVRVGRRRICLLRELRETSLPPGDLLVCSLVCSGALLRFLIRPEAAASTDQQDVRRALRGESGAT